MEVAKVWVGFRESRATEVPEKLQSGVATLHKAFTDAQLRAALAIAVKDAAEALL